MEREKERSILFYFQYTFILITYLAINLEVSGKVDLSESLKLSQDTLAACYLLESEKSLASKGEYQAALTSLKKAQTLYAKHNQWERAIQCVIQASKLADNFETADLKIKYANLSLSLAQKYLSLEHPLLASAFRQKAEAFMMLGKLDSANYFLNQARPLFQKHQDWVNWGWNEILIGVNYLNTYQLDSCQKYLKNTEKIIDNQSIPRGNIKEIQSTLLSLLGILYELQGDYDNAIQNTQQALNLGLKQATKDSSFIANEYKNLGTFYIIKGDYERAFDHFTKAANIYQKGTNNSVFYNSLAELLRRQKKYSAAIDYFQKSLSFEITSEEELKTRINTFNGLGSSFKQLNLYDSSVYFCQKAILLPTNYRKPITWNLMGSIQISKQAPLKALEYLNIAKKTYQQDSTASQHSSFVLSHIYHQIGNAHVLNRNPNTALKFYQKALVTNHATFRDSLNIENNPSLIGIYAPNYFLKAIQGKAQTLASFPDSSKNVVTALTTYQVLIQYTDSLQSIHATETASLDWSGEFKQIYEEAIAVAFRLYQQTQQSEYLELAFSFSEKSKNSLLLESLKATEGKAIVGVPDSLLQKEKDLNIDIAFYEKVLQKAQKNQEEAKTKLYQNYLSKTRLELVALREALEQDFPKFHTLKYGGKETSIADIQSKLLNKKNAFIEYFVGDSSTFVFVITSNTTHFLQLESPSELQKKAVNFREVLLNIAAFQQDAKAAFVAYHKQASILYQSVLAPILTTFSPDIQQLIIAPDDFLNVIPLEALTKTSETTAGFDFAKLPYVLYDYSIQYAYSADLLLQNQAKQNQLPSNADCLAFAPSYQEEGQIANTQRGSLQQLRNATGNLEGTAREIQAIAQFFNGQFDIGGTATERQFKASAAKFGILHLAMHGVPDFENANFNHLQFSNLETDTLEDNLLHHYEIANMDLQAQLVVLSACETGVGKYEKGEGVYSLARSFMYAGVPSVVMSLWKVSDQSTSELMPYFYENLADGESKEYALQRAKIRFLEESDLEYRHPFYWSAFVMMGDAGEIHQGHKWFWYLGIGVLIFGGLGVWILNRRSFFQ